MSVRVAIAVACLLMCSVRGVLAEPTDEQARVGAHRLLIALRVLSYDKRLAERSPGALVTVAIVCSPTKEGRAARAVYEAGFALMPKLKVGGRGIRVVAVEATADTTMASVLTAAAPSMLIVVDALGERLPALRVIARARSILAMSWHEADVSNGLSVAIVAAKEREQIVINLEESRAEGVRFGAGLLQLARLVESGSP